MENLSNIGTPGPLGYECACGGWLLLEKVIVGEVVAPSGQHNPTCVRYYWTCTICEAKIPKEEEGGES